MELAIASKLRVHQPALIGGITAIAPSLQRWEELTQRNLCKKSQRSKIHAQNRKSCRSKRTRSSQQSSIAAQHDHQIRLVLRHVSTVDNVCAIHIGTAHWIKNSRNSTTLKPYQNLRQ